MASINCWFTGIPVILLTAIAIWFITWLIWAVTIGPKSTSRLAITASTSRPCSSMAAHISNMVAFASNPGELQVVAEAKGRHQHLLLVVE